MILGAMLVLAALSLFLYNQKENRDAGEAIEEILPQLAGYLEADTGQKETAFPDAAMTEVEIDGYSYIGYLIIPGLELELPVMSEWDYARLKITPCRYSGSVKTDDLVVAAHNYARHFGMLSKLSEGDGIFFMDMDGVLHTYEVAAVEVLAPTDVEEMTAGEYDLTLFTCTYGGKSRVTVRCERAAEKRSGNESHE